ncbi:hypothetical protein ABFS82_13G130700 [Erythranthe guttata]|uniref:Uncharacterized protein n=1 Tax=Erythranthe guttata TaxID=4155 RepID=A0A022QMK4_ERYGU|nr:PREDICTED: uncharacterized protein LOC105969152 [Erythranthe guttata]EYU27720.1 hypothetical protein MIMGU_mgv1a013145mg [Erythranthe guttata]|eukprot:XP_012849348.1 PREDICTED: uncharacterized protein LOC105969152 [Erythranthe guttata]
MKKLYRKSTVHPTPSVVSEHLLSFLPAAILTLTVALSPADREVLAYLISCSSSASFSNTHRKTTTTTTQKPPAAGGGGSKSGDDHPPCFSCNCFRCYMSYWVKWDSSPNRQLIHEVIDAFEDSVLNKKNKREKNKERRKGNKSSTTTTTMVKGHNSICPVLDDAPKNSDLILTKDDFDFSESNSSADAAAAGASSGGDEDENEEEEELEKGSVRRLVSFLGERIWSVWG